MVAFVGNNTQGVDRDTPVHVGKPIQSVDELITCSSERIQSLLLFTGSAGRRDQLGAVVHGRLMKTACPEGK